MDAFLVNAHLLPHAMLAQVPAVIAAQDNDGVILQFEAIQGVEDFADLCVHERSRSVITADGLAALLRAESMIRSSGVALTGQGEGWVRRAVGGGKLRHADALQRIHL